jgi:hypothetical protein
LIEVATNPLSFWVDLKREVVEGVSKSIQVDPEILFLEIQKIKEMKSTFSTEFLLISTVSCLSMGLFDQTFKEAFGV